MNSRCKFDKKLLIFGFIALIFSIVLSVGCSKVDDGYWNKLNTKYSVDDLDLVTSGTLSVATQPGYVPFGFMDNDRLSGIDIDLIHMISDSLGIKSYITPYDFGSTIDLTNSIEKYDIIVASCEKTKELEKILDCSIPYYTLHSKVHLCCNKNLDINESKIDEIINNPDSKVAVSFFSVFKDIFEESYPNVKYLDIYSVTEMMDNLNNCKVPLGVIDSGLYETYNCDNTLKIIKSYDFDEEVVVCVKKGNEKLLETINEILSARLSDSSISKIIDKYKDLTPSFENVQY